LAIGDEKETTGERTPPAVKRISVGRYELKIWMSVQPLLDIWRQFDRWRNADLTLTWSETGTAPGQESAGGSRRNT
jgi:hypothetical protein